MIIRTLLRLLIAVTALGSTGVAPAQAQVPWDGERYVEILLLPERGRSLPVDGGCYIIWSREALANPLAVCDNATADLVPVLDIGWGEGAPVEATAMSDLAPSSGLIWVDVSSIGPKVLITEAVPPMGLQPYTACDTGFAPCSQDGSDTQIGATTVFLYNTSSSVSSPQKQPQPTASLECEFIEQYPFADQPALLIPALLAAAEEWTGSWGTDILEAILINALDRWEAGTAFGEIPGDVTFAEYLSQELGC